VNAQIKWSDAEYDLIAKVALTMPEGTPRAEMLREGQKALPKQRQKTIPDHLGGKSFKGLLAALERVQAGVRADQRRGAATKARSAMAEVRKTLAGQGERMAEAMKRASKSDIDVATATGVHLHSIRTVLRDRTKTMMDKNVAKVATYLGCNYGWLRSGIAADMPVEFTIDAVADNKPPALTPTPQAVFKANGKANGGHHAKRIVKTYSSELESGGEHYQVVRFPSRHHIA